MFRFLSFFFFCLSTKVLGKMVLVLIIQNPKHTKVQADLPNLFLSRCFLFLQYSFLLSQRFCNFFFPFNSNFFFVYFLCMNNLISMGAEIFCLSNQNQTKPEPKQSKPTVTHTTSRRQCFEHYAS